MKLPDRAKAIVRGVWHRAWGALSDAERLALTDDERRAVTRQMAEQLRFELGADWGWKSASPTRPPSKDAVAKWHEGRLLAWDTVDGGTRKPHEDPESIDITGQHFIAVPGVDHLGVGTPEPLPPPPPPPPLVCECRCTPDLSPLLARLDAIESLLRGTLRVRLW